MRQNAEDLLGKRLSDRGSNGKNKSAKDLPGKKSSNALLSRLPKKLG